MWSCANCHEIVEEQFDACWQCGCSRDGTLNLHFASQASTDTEGDGSDLEKQFAQHFICARCKHSEARIERVIAAGAGFAQMMKKDFLAISCENCGLTEFYNLSVLEGRSDLQNFLCSVFGM